MKKLALAQHLRFDTITYNNVIYINVELEDFNIESGSNYQDVEEITENNQPFLNWLIENGSLLEDEIIQSNYDTNLFEYGSEEYLVCTDEEADELWEEDLENYIDDCILPDLNEAYHCYFDREAWKNDARLYSRSNSLNRYDGIEYIEYVYNNQVKETYYIYQQN